MYPYRIPASASVVSQWAGDEEASWEDKGEPQEGHVFPILERHKRAIEVRSDDEARLLLKSAHYHGDLMAWDWDGRHAYRKAVRRLYDQIAQREQLAGCVMHEPASSTHA